MPADAAVASVPYPNDRPHYAWVPPGATGWEKLFVVQIPSGIRKITSDNYLNFLSDRLAWMARRSGNPEGAMGEIETTFNDAGLLSELPRSTALGVFTIDVIALNANFSPKAVTMLGRLPVDLADFAPTALVTLSRVAIGEWLQEVRRWSEQQPRDKKVRSPTKPPQ